MLVKKSEGISVKILKYIIVLLLIIVGGVAGYNFFIAGNRSNNIDIKSKKFYLMIENYSTPKVDVSVSTLKRSSDLIGQTVSVRCRIDQFKDSNEKIGIMLDTVRKDKLDFIFVGQKIPDGELWQQYLKIIAGSKTNLIMHGRLIKADKKLYFVPQRLFTADRADIHKIVEEHNKSKQQNLVPETNK